MPNAGCRDEFCWLAVCHSARRERVRRRLSPRIEDVTSSSSFSEGEGREDEFSVSLRDESFAHSDAPPFRVAAFRSSSTPTRADPPRRRTPPADDSTSLA